MKPAAAGLLWALLLAGCHTQPGHETPAGTAAPAVPAVPAAATGTAALTVRYDVDAAQSDVRVYVKREGPMAALGHNHVIAIRQLAGVVYVADELRASRFELRFPVADVGIDDPAQRAAAGADYTSVVNDAARAGTRNNLLGDKLLQAALYPEILINSGAIVVAAPGAAVSDGLLVELQVRVRDRTSVMRVPVRWQRDGDTLRAESSFTLQQSALGLTPFSVALGALRVADAIEVRCLVVARRARTVAQ